MRIMYVNEIINQWQDQYIQEAWGEENSDFRFICFDERGRYIGHSGTKEGARVVVTDYVDKYHRVKQ
jgi:hypothetical protein